MAEYLTTAQKRKLQAQAEFEASLGPKGGRKPPPPRTGSPPTPSQILLIVDPVSGLARRDGKLHGPGCRALPAWEAKGWPNRRATAEELGSGDHGACLIDGCC